MTLAAFFVQLLIAVVLAVVSYMLAPKPKSAKNDSTRALEAPTADAGRPIPVVFGDVTVKGPNCLWYGDMRQRVVEVNA